LLGILKPTRAGKRDLITPEATINLETYDTNTNKKSKVSTDEIIEE